MKSDSDKNRILQRNQTKNLKPLDHNLSENIEALKEQVEIAIKSVDETLIDTMLVGSTPIQNNKSVVLSWSLEPEFNPPVTSDNAITNGDKDIDNPDDGIVLYVAIKMKKKSANDMKNDEIDKSDPNNNTTDLSRLVYND